MEPVGPLRPQQGRHLRGARLPRVPGAAAAQVSCDWWRAGHVTPVLTSDWLQRLRDPRGERGRDPEEREQLHRRRGLGRGSPRRAAGRELPRPAARPPQVKYISTVKNSLDLQKYFSPEKIA